MPPPVILSQPAWLVADQAQSGVVVTSTSTVAPAAGTVMEVGDAT